MNTPNPEDEKLRGLLRAAHEPPALPPRFQEAVWHRLERGEAESAGRASWFEQVLARVLRPQWIAVTLGLFLLAGVVTGLEQGRDRAGREARARYLAAVNPLEQR